MFVEDQPHCDHSTVSRKCWKSSPDCPADRRRTIDEISEIANVS
jgi:hypothetical protein